MMFSIESTPILGSRLMSDGSRYARGSCAPRKLRAHAAAVFARLRDLAPYAAIELILPGGSLLALLLWLYRRYKREAVAPGSLGMRSIESAKSAPAGDDNGAYPLNIGFRAWRVRDDVAPRLIPAMLLAERQHPDLSRAQALRQASLAILDDHSISAADPSAWAPFTLVGEAGR